MQAGCGGAVLSCRAPFTCMLVVSLHCLTNAGMVIVLEVLQRIGNASLLLLKSAPELAADMMVGCVGRLMRLSAY